MGVIASRITGNATVYSTLYRLTSKKTSKLESLSLCKGNPLVTSGFSSQRTSSPETFAWHNVHPFRFSFYMFRICHDISRKFIGQFEKFWIYGQRHQFRITYNHLNFFADSIVSADGLAPLSYRTSTGAVMTKFAFRICLKKSWKLYVKHSTLKSCFFFENVQRVNIFQHLHKTKYWNYKISSS